MTHLDKRGLFDFAVENIKYVAAVNGMTDAHAFSKWYLRLCYGEDAIAKVSDGPGDGKVDAFVRLSTDYDVQHILLNSKFTERFDQIAPPTFYNEIAKFHRAFSSEKDPRGFS